MDTSFISLGLQTTLCSWVYYLSHTFQVLFYKTRILEFIWVRKKEKKHKSTIATVSMQVPHDFSVNAQLEASQYLIKT